jgi:hypothetical protein
MGDGVGITVPTWARTRPIHTIAPISITITRPIKILSLLIWLRPLNTGSVGTGPRPFFGGR